MTRSKRKQEHIKYALTSGLTSRSQFEDVKFVHNSLPNIKSEGVNIDCKIGELNFSSPIFINAMTGGGGKETLIINEQLATLAKETDLAIAVGSQMAALKDPQQKKSFEIVRQVYKDGFIIANVGMDASLKHCYEAVEMIEANALQIHLNLVQELLMPEGDRDFSDKLQGIEEVVRSLDIPVIVKEVGFGMSREVVKQLSEIGVKAIDIGGYGGTNFAEIENKRRTSPLTYFNDWGISTTVSLFEALSVESDVPILASGGISESDQICKALAIGASGVGIARPILSKLVEEGLDSAVQYVNRLKSELKILMTALGAKEIQDLQSLPIVISGETHHWLQERGIKTSQFARR